jgi:hypothetical protein
LLSMLRELRSTITASLESIQRSLENKGCPAQTSSTIFANREETPCLFAMQW